MTAEDRRAQIDRRFEETFAVFDDRMRKEQETISQERAAGSGTGSGPGMEGYPGEGAEGSGTEGQQGEGGREATEDSGAAGGEGASGEAGSGSSGEQGGGGGVGGGGPLGGSGPSNVPSDVPDGRDDDIVARQLREAAMKETDPELRERLWEEYRQYKKSTQ
jgi:hypothetical protein